MERIERIKTDFYTSNNDLKNNCLEYIDPI